MINNNILSNRLNQTRQGKVPNSEKSEEFNNPLNSSDNSLNESTSNKLPDLSKLPQGYLAAYFLGESVIKIGRFSLTSIIFGLAANVLNNSIWSFPQLAVVGLAFGIIATSIFSLFSKK